MSRTAKIENILNKTRKSASKIIPSLKRSKIDPKYNELYDIYNDNLRIYMTLIEFIKKIDNSLENLGNTNNEVKNFYLGHKKIAYKNKIIILQENIKLAKFLKENGFDIKNIDIENLNKDIDVTQSQLEKLTRSQGRKRRRKERTKKNKKKPKKHKKN